MYKLFNNVKHNFSHIKLQHLAVSYNSITSPISATSYITTTISTSEIITDINIVTKPALVALLVALRYVLPGYGDQRVWVRIPGWPDNCVRL